jgi:hypothetical protein
VVSFLTLPQHTSSLILQPISNIKMSMGTGVDRTLEFHEICMFLGAAKRAPLATAVKTESSTAEAPSLADFHQVGHTFLFLFNVLA